MSEHLLKDTVSRLFEALVTKELIEAMEGGLWPREAWAQCEELGLPRVWVPESAGGYGVDPAEAMEVVRLVGQYAVPLPLVETMYANRLAAISGLAIEEGPTTFAPVHQRQLPAMRATSGGWHLRGALESVPWARWARHVIVLAQAPEEQRFYLARVPSHSLALEPGNNLAGEPRDTVRFDLVLPDTAVASLPEEFGWSQWEGAAAALRALQIAGALTQVLDLSVQYANERVQFGRPLGKFQAVQQNLAVLAGWVVTATAAADIGAEALIEGPTMLPIAVAKARTSEAAGSAAAIAHQVHGAMGFTREHRLHTFTRRLWSWRDEFGNEGYWHRQLGRLTFAAGADGWWPMVTATPYVKAQVA